MAWLVLWVLLLMLAVMAAAWLTVGATRNGGWTDVFWTYGTGASLALAALAPVDDAALPNARQIMVAALAAIWALRLGTYVAVRVASGPEDARYAAMRNDWGEAFQRRMLVLVLPQAPVTAVLSVSVLLAARNPAPALRLEDLAGGLILVAAIVGEAVCDGQMKRFKAEPANSGKVCDTGLWAWSRHPNYLFEALGWFAYPVIAIDPARPVTVLSLAAPVTMLLVLRFVTGVPPLEAAMLRSKGEAYRRYQARVSPFLPRPPKPPARHTSARETPE